MASTKTNAAPITAHPGFPLVVALWFAALLGLGSLILPAAMIERLVTSTGIAAIIPAAAPPLGFAGRATIALGGMVLGALLGLFAARKIARPAPESARRRSVKADEQPRGQNSKRQPLNAREELGSASFDSVAGFATARRRALAGEEESRPSDFLQFPPLPGSSGRYGFAYGDDYAAPAAKDPLDLSECAEFTEDQDPPVQTPSQEEFSMSQMQIFPSSRAEFGAGEPLPFSPPSMARQSAPAQPDAQTEAQPQDEIEVATFEEDHDLTPEAPEPRQDFIPAETAPAAEEPVAQQVELAPTEPTSETTALPDLVQLVEQLGATLERHREWSARRVQQQPEAPRFPRAVALDDGSAELVSNFEAAAPAEAAEAMAAFFASPPAHVGVEQADAAEPTLATSAPQPQLRPFAGFGQIEDADDDEDPDQFAASFSLPLSRAAVPAAEMAAQDDEASPEAPETEGEAEGETYSSLLVMKNPFRDHRPEFVRVEEPEPEAEAEAARPAVVFPHEAPAARMFDRPNTAESAAVVVELPAPSPAPRPAASTGDNDRVLREALMNLQRIGKN